MHSIDICIPQENILWECINSNEINKSEEINKCATSHQDCDVHFQKRNVIPQGKCLGAVKYFVLHHTEVMRNQSVLRDQEPQISNVRNVTGW